MFTGLIQDIGTIRSIHVGAQGASLAIQTQLDTKDIAIGESIAVQGACLTVTALEPHQFSADCSPETLRRTTLGQKRTGHRVHLERALRLGDRLGGHLVSGHIDGTGRIVSTSKEGNALLLAIAPPQPLLRYIIEKGSIAVEGVSLTVNTLSTEQFDLAIIPHTRQATLLDQYRPGDMVNLEVDLIGKYIERLLAPWKPSNGPEEQSSSLNEAFLKEHGFF